MQNVGDPPLLAHFSDGDQPTSLQRFDCRASDAIVFQKEVDEIGQLTQAALDEPASLAARQVRNGARPKSSNTCGA